MFIVQAHDKDIVVEISRFIIVHSHNYTLESNPLPFSIVQCKTENQFTQEELSSLYTLSNKFYLDYYYE
jgi:hypothetical protein